MMRIPALLSLLTVLGILAAPARAQPCPGDSTPRAAGTLLTVQIAGGPVLALGAADLGALPAAALTQKQTVSSSGTNSGTSGGGNGSERSVTWGGVLLRDALLKADFGGPADRAARTGVIEALATDGYRAVFSWGEVFNSGVGDQLIVITQVDGQPLDAAAGPVALRSLADARPGPRHVRNLCALRVRRL